MNFLVLLFSDKDTHKKLALDAMYQLEHGANDKTKMKKAMPALAEIEEKQSVNKDDYMLNKMARNIFRVSNTFSVD